MLTKKEQIFNFLRATPGTYQIKDLVFEFDFDCDTTTVGEVLRRLKKLKLAETKRVGNDRFWTVRAAPLIVTDWSDWPDPMEWVSEV